ncbi:AZOBR_p60025 family cell surface glycopolymer formation protein [Aphanothece sacrum]|uniref:Glycosyltransferase RgtA/B/C/D-like domain-containing protein n=1 Tax=Aphanothece sacrum FPU1 TaxID=1920663 RepID=A0A401IFH8_APHSA|nr:DUF2029 domain-containing protein [Aphanothece sacrum]GBF80035.1 hypothetical protein AsFPU1_1436 [Aphanothece sacrum FPU1]GBF84578.1 hypothetical protein AsFPU3_1630 [Aphanothece sacrum FPU3]
MKRLSLKLSPELINIIIAFIVVTIITIYFYFVKFDGNITGFFRIGSILQLSPYLNPNNTIIYQGEIGYDGQQFLSLAFDPFLQNPETINSLDHPIYRYRRILYPLISYLFSFGNQALIPYVMVGVNYLSIIIIVWIISLYFKSDKTFQWQSLLTLCIPGVWMVLSLGTADLLSSLFLILAFYGYRWDKPIVTGVAISLACLTRETLILMGLALILASIWQRKHKYIKPLLFSLLPPLLWTGYINLLNLPGKIRVKDNFGYPFVGIFNKFISLITGGINAKNIFEAYMFILLLTILISIFFIVKNRCNYNLIYKLSGIFYSAMFIFSSMTILGYYLDYSRVFMDVYFILLLTYNENHIPWKTGLISTSALGNLAFLVLHS